MEIITMGKVMGPARIENLEDVYQAERGELPAQQVRSIDVPEALVDTGATLLSIPGRLVRQLGLKRTRTRRAKTAAGIVEFGIHQAVRLTVEGRDCIVEVAEIPDQCPVLIGQVPLELLDFVVDPAGRKLVGNPDHGGKQMIDLF